MFRHLCTSVLVCMSVYAWVRVKYHRWIIENWHLKGDDIAQSLTLSGSYPIARWRKQKPHTLKHTHTHSLSLYLSFPLSFFYLQREEQKRRWQSEVNVLCLRKVSFEFLNSSDWEITFIYSSIGILNVECSRIHKS